MAQQHTLLLSPSEAPAIRCKTCKVPLPDATRKNCERCRRNRTERFNRWKISVEAKKNLISFPTPVTHPSPAPSLNVNIRWMKPATTSAACSQPSHQSCPGSGMPSSAPLDPYLNEHQAATSHRPKDTPRLMSSLPRDIDIPEYQWGEELVDTLLALPPRSNFFGKFSVIADPDVDNSKRHRCSWTKYAPRASLHRIHRNMSPATRIPPADARSVCTANARLGVKAGSLSLSTATPRTASECPVNVSVSHFYTRRDEISLWYSPHSHHVCCYVIHCLFGTTGQTHSSINSENAWNRCAWWCLQNEIAKRR